MRRLASHLERAQPNPWQVEQMHSRYGGAAAAHRRLSCPGARTQATFKLGQDENAATFREIVTGLARSPLAELMAEQGTPK